MAKEKKPLSDELKGFLSNQGRLEYYEKQFKDPTVNSVYWNAELEGLQKAYDAQQRREARSLGAGLPPSIPITPSTASTTAPSAPATTATSTWSFSWLKAFLSALSSLFGSKSKASPSTQTPITASKDPTPPTFYASSTTTRTPAPPKEFPEELKKKIKEYFGEGREGLAFYEWQFKTNTPEQWQKTRAGVEEQIQRHEKLGQPSDPKPSVPHTTTLNPGHKDSPAPETDREIIEGPPSPRSGG